MIVTFSGHRDTPSFVYNLLYQTLKALIEKENACTFYVGNEGNFDKMVYSVLRQLKFLYPHIKYCVVLAYLPHGKSWASSKDETVFPAEIVAVPPRFAIEKRNDWMLKRSDVLVSYVVNSFGGAAKTKRKALARKKKVIELSALVPSLPCKEEQNK